MSKRSNVQLLTEGAAYIQRAKKARVDQVDEIKFDEDARREWLTGFSKRKKAKVEERRARAKERDHKAHLEERRKARQELRERAAQNVKDVRAAMGLPALDEQEDGSDDGSDAGSSEPAEIEEAFSDDEQMATVTITQDFDPSEAAERAVGPDSDEDEDGDEGEDGVAKSKSKGKEKAAVPLMPASSRRAEQRAKRHKEEKDKKKEDKKSKSMETPAERRRAKEYDARKRAKAYEKAKARGEDVRFARSKGGKGTKGAKGGKVAKGAKGKGKGRK